MYFTTSAVANKIADSANVTLNCTDENTTVADADEASGIFYIIIWILIVIGMIILYFVNPDLFWMIILSCGHSSSGGSSSHSGRSSGGSFGGGFSGGGGASR